MRKLNLERVRHAQRFIVGDNPATVEWARASYKELVASGEAHARPYRALIIDTTGEKKEIVTIDVEKYLREARTESSG